MSDSHSWWPGCGGTRCPGALTQPGVDGGPLGSELRQGRGNKVLLVSVMQEGWVERNFFFIFIIHLFDLGLPGSTRDPLLWCMSVMTQQPVVAAQGPGCSTGVGSQPHHACSVTSIMSDSFAMQ